MVAPIYSTLCFRIDIGHKAVGNTLNDTISNYVRDSTELQYFSVVSIGLLYSYLL